MADIDTVLERLVTDAGFRTALSEDPAQALSGYDLGKDDLELLASSLDDGDTGQRGVEQRTSKSAVLGLLASLSSGGGAAVPDSLAAPPRETAAQDFLLEIDGVKGESKGAPPPAPGDFAPAGKVEADAGMIKSVAVSNLKAGDTEAGAFPKKIEFGQMKAGDTSRIGKDSAGLDELAAPADDSEAAIRKMPGKPKPGEITLTRSTQSQGADPELESGKLGKLGKLGLDTEPVGKSIGQDASSITDSTTPIGKDSAGLDADVAPPLKVELGEDLLSHKDVLPTGDANLAPPEEKQDFLTIEDA